MTPEHVLQERKDRQESRARPFTQEEEDADLEMMEALYQERLRQKEGDIGSRIISDGASKT